MHRIPEYSQYLIDTAGNIFSEISNKYLTPHTQRSGYPAFTLIHDSKGKTTVPTHRLLAMVYIPNPENKREVNHIDGNKSNNNLDNLEWVHGYENIRHAFATKLAKTRANMPYEEIDRIVQKLPHDADTSWASMAATYGYSDSSGFRKLIKRDFCRRGKSKDFVELCSLLRLRRGIRHSTAQKGRVAHNRKQVKVTGGGTYESLVAASTALGLSPSKACVAIKLGKPIKGYYLEYA